MRRGGPYHFQACISTGTGSAGCAGTICAFAFVFSAAGAVVMSAIAFHAAQASRT
jgi:hypothetical protein